MGNYKKKLGLLLIIFLLAQLVGCNNSHTLYYSDGRVKYEGGWKDNKEHGKGRLYESDGTLIYEGQFSKGSFHGKGKLYESDGTLIYEGHFSKGLFYGEGKLFESEGNLLYEGQFVDDKFEGKGTMYLAADTKISGEWENGTVVKGLIIINEIVHYDGEFRNGKYHGEGIEYFNGDIKYKGTFKDGKYDGIGKLYNDGIKYIGEFKDGKYHGEGELFVDENLLYEGDFFNGDYHGIGKQYHENGTLKHSGKYRNNAYDREGTLFDENGNIIFDGIFSLGSMKDGVYKVYENNLVKEEFVGTFKEDKYDNGVRRLYGEGSVTSEYNIYNQYIKSYKVFDVPQSDFVEGEGMWNGTGIINASLVLQQEEIDEFNKGKTKSINGYIRGEFEQGKIIEDSIIFYDENFIKLYEGPINNGKIDGYGIGYDMGGRLVYQGEWKEGLWHGEGKSYWPETGKVFFDTTYKNGFKHGDYTRYYSDGTLNDKGRYENGERVYSNKYNN
ncbi:MAG: hypothetical protein LRY71_06350 [Bacillaceae bacterium]|nr:hypothetical protein [Bacillaceae bacterium]